MTTTILEPVTFHLTVTPGRRAGTQGFRVQVHDHTGKPLLNESALPWRRLGLWRATFDGALWLGVSEAYEIRDMDGDTDHPLVVHGHGHVLVDETREGMHP